MEDNERGPLLSLLKYIANGLEYLDNSTLNIIPFEVVSCLEKALGDWTITKEFIIVTSLSNSNLDFAMQSYDTQEIFLMLNEFITKRYNTSITNRLIRIILPKNLSRDYLSCVVLYHELGHFVDHELNISKKIFLKNYGKTDPQNNIEAHFLNHTKEYFADLFAAQYVSNASNLYLDHIAHKNPQSTTHPSTDERINVVNDFLSSSSGDQLRLFQEVLTQSNSPNLIARFEEILMSCSFEKLIPHEIKTDKALHYLFKIGWDCWMDSDINFLRNFSPRQRYHIINNLIEKSISNYFIQLAWTKYGKD